MKYYIDDELKDKSDINDFLRSKTTDPINIDDIVLYGSKNFNIDLSEITGININDTRFLFTISITLLISESYTFYGITIHLSDKKITDLTLTYNKRYELFKSDVRKMKLNEMISGLNSL